MEPRGKFEFDWLDRLSILHSQDQVVLGTPTASPSPWLMHAYPEISNARRPANYLRQLPGIPAHPVYRALTADLSWQHTTLTPPRHHLAIETPGELLLPFCSPSAMNGCAGATTPWKAERKWGTVLEPHYSDSKRFRALLSGSPNPGLALDFFRFISDTYFLPAASD
jgi:beta-galactosidase GanA